MSAAKNTPPKRIICPGDSCELDEHICRARQARGYPPCKLCDVGVGRVKVDTRPQSSQDQLIAVLDKIVKAYDIRGSYPEEVNEDVAWRLGYATADFLLSQVSGYARAEASSRSMVVGRDMRIGSPELAAAFIDGALSAGADVVDIGMIDSPQLYFAINYLGGCGGAQITASHNPAGDNGFKISGQGARPVGGDTGLDKIKTLAVAARPGIVRDRDRGTVRQQDLTAEYKEHVLKFAGPISPMKVVIDACNGMGGKFVPLLFGDLPITVTPMNFEHDGHFVHPPNPLVEENLDKLKKTVVRRKADLGVSFDGDADRCVFVDEKGQMIRPDLVTAVLAKEFLFKEPGATIVYDLRSSHIVPELITERKGVPRRERVGHAFMKHAMSDSGAIMGGELSGHYYYRDNWHCDSGFITFVVMLTALSQADVPMSRLMKPVQKYYHTGEINFEVDNKQAVLDRILATYRQANKARIDMRDGVTVELEKYWFNIRPSNTEPKLRLNLEAGTQAMMEQKLAEVTRLIRPPTPEELATEQKASRKKKVVGKKKATPKKKVSGGKKASGKKKVVAKKKTGAGKKPVPKTKPAARKKSAAKGKPPAKKKTKAKSKPAARKKRKRS